MVWWMTHSVPAGALFDIHKDISTISIGRLKMVTEERFVAQIIKLVNGFATDGMLTMEWRAGVLRRIASYLISLAKVLEI